MIPKKTDAERLEQKIDDLALDWAKKFDKIHEQFEKIGRLEERIAAYMGIAERIEQENRDGVNDLKVKYADHEARLRSLEATNAATSTRARISDGAITRLLIPVFVALFLFLAAEWARGRPSVTVTSAPVINPPSKETAP